MISSISQQLGASQRRVCRLFGQPRSTQRYKTRGRLDEERLRGRVVALAASGAREFYPRDTHVRRSFW